MSFPPALIHSSPSNLQEFALGGPVLEHIGDGDGGISIGEVRVVHAAAHRDAEAKATLLQKGDFFIYLLFEQGRENSCLYVSVYIHRTAT